jgi:hypothetical protein
MDPEQALAAARAAAAAQPDGGKEDEPDLGLPTASARSLSEWAIVEPEPGRVYSTRRLGRPITALKRALIRLLDQYLGQITAQQSRFNAQIAAHVARLEERIAELESAPGSTEDQGDGPAPRRPG